MLARFELQFEKSPLGYIANPYWPEVEWCLKIEQKAGVHPRHKDDKKRKLIEHYCNQNGISLADFDAARVKIATQRWYFDKNGDIYIPRHHISGMLVQTIQGHRLKSSVNVDQLRSFLQVYDAEVLPKKQKLDFMFSRYIKNPESNMRRLQEDEVISDFVAVGTLNFNPDIFNIRDVEDLFSYGGRWVGIGSSRKMGYGRYSVKEMKEMEEVDEILPRKNRLPQIDSSNGHEDLTTVGIHSQD